MADKDVIKALENRFAETFDTGWTKIHHNELSNLINLINRQQAEIERLKEEVEKLKDKYEVVYQPIAMVKAEAKVEAYKEFADRFITTVHERASEGKKNQNPYILQSIMKDLVKEMVGDDK